MIRVAVFGAAGRMGATTCAAVAEADELELVAAIDPVAAGLLLGEVAGRAGASIVGQPALIEVAAEPDAFLTAGGVQVAVDFTATAAALDNLRWCAENGIHAVCGTTGFTQSDRADIEDWFRDSNAHCVLAPNFSIGAVLMMRCAAFCAPYLDGVEIIELHHDRKRDAPSGTSLETARQIEQARSAHEGTGPFRSEPTEQRPLEGTRGGVTAGGVQVHSVRLPGLVAHQEVIFGSLGETLTIRHDSMDRVSFMPGVLLAIRRVAERAGVTYGLEPLLGL